MNHMIPTIGSNEVQCLRMLCNKEFYLFSKFTVTKKNSDQFHVRKTAELLFLLLFCLDNAFLTEDGNCESYTVCSSSQLI